MHKKFLEESKVIGDVLRPMADLGDTFIYEEGVKNKEKHHLLCDRSHRVGLWVYLKELNPDLTKIRIEVWCVGSRYMNRSPRFLSYGDLVYAIDVMQDLMKDLEDLDDAGKDFIGGDDLSGMNP